MDTAREPSPAEAADARLRILVVEDDATDYDLLLLHLRRHGLRPQAKRVETAEAMREALESEDWDAVISDYNLPLFSALGAIQTLRHSGRDIPFILMSGAIGEERAVEAMRAGAEDYIPKDRPARLVPALRRGVSAAVQRRERRDAEASLTAAAANLPGVLFRLRTTPEGAVASFPFMSNGALRLFGIAPERAAADPEAFLERLSDEDRERLRSGLASAARTGATWRDELRIRTEAGAQRWVQASASPRRTDRGLLWDGLIVDVTPIKDAEESLRESERQLRSLSAHLERAKEGERAEVAREIHDEIGGSLTAMKADLASLARRLPGDDQAAERLASLESLVGRAMASSQSIARALRPAALDHGLYPALAWQARDFEARHGIACRVVANDEELQLDLDSATALFRICQEALTNVVKHAGATAVELNLFATSTQVSLEVRDDGRGVDPKNLDKTGSFGVFGMYERVRNLGGWLEIDGGGGGGTTIMVTLPRAKPRTRKTP